MLLLLLLLMLLLLLLLILLMLSGSGVPRVFSDSCVLATAWCVFNGQPQQQVSVN